MRSRETIEKEITNLKKDIEIINMINDGKILCVKSREPWLYYFLNKKSSVLGLDSNEVVEFTEDIETSMTQWRLPTREEMERCTLLTPNLINGNPMDFDVPEGYDVDKVYFASYDRNLSMYAYHGRRCQSYNDNAHDNAIINDISYSGITICDFPRLAMLVRIKKVNTNVDVPWYCKDNLHELEWKLLDDNKLFTDREIDEAINTLNKGFKVIDLNGE